MYSNTVKKLPCPYYTRNPDGNYSNSCHGYFIRLHRLRRHLMATHKRGPQCQRCWMMFSTSSDLTDHLNPELVCEEKPEPENETFNDATYAKIRDRKRFTGTDEEIWMVIWRTLFPNDGSSSLSKFYATKGGPIDSGSFGIISVVYHIMEPEKLFARKQLLKFKIKQEVFQKEVDIMRIAPEHRHLASLVDTYEDEDSYYIVIRPLAKQSLQKYLDREIGRPEDSESWIAFGQKRLQLFRWMYCLAVTLSHLHNSNIRHRDIKPSNILVGRRSSGSSVQVDDFDGEICFTDFGISFAHDGATIETLTLTRGTRRYEPPEAFVKGDSDEERRNRIGRKGDVFSLGCVFLDMLAAICRSLGFAFPDLPMRYADIVNDDDLLYNLPRVPELKPRFNRIPDDIKYLGLTNELLEFIASKMTVSKERRQTAEGVVNGLQGIMLRHSFAFPDCCAQYVLPSPLAEHDAVEVDARVGRASTATEAPGSGSGE